MSAATSTPARVPAAPIRRAAAEPEVRGAERAGAPVRWDLVLLVGVGVLAFAMRLQMAVRGGGLLGIGAYDDGVHYAAAASLLHGRLPYRDFLFLQPPGMVFAAAPFAGAGRVLGDPVGLIGFRIAFQLIGAANAVLVALVLRRFGRPAALTGGVFYAVFLHAVYDERTALLEPIGTLAVLVALLLTARGGSRAGWVAGLALGVACGFKIWYVVPALVIVAFARSARLRVLGGAVIGGVVVYLPFFLPAPVAMFQQIVLAQVGRARSSDGPFMRAKVLLGVHGLKDVTPLPGVGPGLLTLVLLVLLAVAVVVALRTPGARVLVALLAADGAVLLASPSFFAHYAALTAPVLALLLGVAVGGLARHVRRRPLRVAGVLVVLVAVVVLNARHDLARVDRRVPVAQLQAAAAREPGCITSDDPTLLAVMDVLNRDLDAGCPLRVDPSGYSFGPAKEVVDGAPVARKANATYQREMRQYLLSGDAFIQVRGNARLSDATKAVLATRPLLVEESGFALRRGDGTGGSRS